MASTGKSVWIIIALLSVFFLILSFVSYLFLPEPDTNENALKITPTLNLPSGAIVNNKLSNLKKYSLDKYTGAEDLVVYEGSLYTGVKEGKILRINESGVFDFTRLSDPGCKTVQECGRPLGMKLMDNLPYLIIADAYLGLFNVSLKDGTYKKIFPLDDSFNVTFFNSLVILSNESVIVSETSVKYGLQELHLDLMYRSSNGRLLMVDLKTGNYRQIANNLHFANGIEMHSDGKSILIIETSLCRILRLPLDGGPMSIFADGLPGIPDNIKSSKHGGYWVPVANLRETFIGSLLTDKVYQYPSLFDFLGNIFSIVPLPFISKTMSSMLLRLDDHGQIIEVWKDPDNKVTNVAGIVEHGNILHTTSYYLPYIGTLDYK